MGCPMYLGLEEDPVQPRQTQLSEIKENLEEMINIVKSLTNEQELRVHDNRAERLIQQLFPILKNLDEMIVIVESLLDAQEMVQDNRDGRLIQRRHDPDWDWESEIERGMPELLEPGW